MRLLMLCAVLLASKPLSHARSLQKRSAEAITEMAEYFGKYAQLPNAVEGVAKMGFTSDGGEDAEDFETLPAFVERVLEMQIATGLEKTGKVSQELLEEAKRSRCGVNDPPRESDELGAYVVKAMWNSKYDPKSQIYPLTFSITEQKDIPDGLDSRAVEEGLLSAMCLWESNSKVRFMNVGNGNLMADITVSFEQGDHGDWYSFDGTGGTLAHAFYPENGMLHFDKAENWYLAQKGSVDYYKKDLFTVAAHELGHNIGLMHSEKRGALMAPIYKYSGTITEYTLPDDDAKGVENMYGQRTASNPADEPGTACNLLRDKFGIASDNLVASTKTQDNIKPSRRTRCKDDRLYRKYCPKWHSQGYCEHPVHGKTLRRRCKHSCGFCPAKPMKRKPRREEAVSSISHSVCGVEQFDSVAVVLDARNVLNMLYFKDDFYFESSQILDANTSSHYSLLDTTEELDNVVQWHTDPKTIKVGTYKIQQPDMFAKSKHVSAVLLTKNWYLAFEKREGIVHRYSLGTPTTVYLGNFTVRSTFHGYPHKGIDAGFVEFDVGPDNDTVFTLFHNDLMWQYQEIVSSDPRIQLDKLRLQLRPISSKQGVPIQQWHGVQACRIDSVFQYRGIPYFLKGNTFWPAVDSEPMIPRDITYNFLRCWEEEPVLDPNPPLCEVTFDKQTSKEDDENGAERNHVFFLATLLPILVYVLESGFQ